MDRKVVEVSSLSLSFSDYLPTYLPMYVFIYWSLSLSLSFIHPSIHPSIYLSEKSPSQRQRAPRALRAWSKQTKWGPLRTLDISYRSGTNLCMRQWRWMEMAWAIPPSRSALSTALSTASPFSDSALSECHLQILKRRRLNEAQSGGAWKEQNLKVDLSLHWKGQPNWWARSGFQRHPRGSDNRKKWSCLWSDIVSMLKPLAQSLARFFPAPRFLPCDIRVATSTRSLVEAMSCKDVKRERKCHRICRV